MDPSALIFVALAVAWAVYLVPKALQHHDQAVRSRSVERFSASMRVLARREPVSRRDARLVVTPSRRVSIPLVHTKGKVTRDEAAPEVRRTDPVSVSASAVAARRRRRVLGLVLLSLVAVAAVAGFGIISWAWTAIPAGLLVAWLVACRLMVKSERRARLQPSVAPAATSGQPVPREPSGESDDQVAADTGPDEAPAVVAEAPPSDPNAWDMVPTTLPTYVSKPAAARRTVQTIDLESTGVWSSGRNAGDSALAREAEEADRASRDAEERRATGS